MAAGALGAVVVHYRAWAAAEASVRALLAGTRPPDHVLIVDNASGERPPAALRTCFSVEILHAPENRGPAAAMNLGVARMLARGVESILLLTADCVVAPTTLAALEDRLSVAPRVGAVGPLLAHSSARGRVFSAGGRIDRGTWDPGHHRQPGEVDDWDGAGPLACEWLDGACVLVRAGALRETGPFDEAYFHYFDDVDLHLRMRSRGWDVECVPTALAWQEPSEIRPALWTRNRLRFLARHAPRRVLVRELGRQARNAGRDLRARDHQRAAERARGVALFLTRRWGPLGRGRTPATPRAPY